MAECSALNRTFTQPTLRLGEQRGKGSERMHKPEEGKRPVKCLVMTVITI